MTEQLCPARPTAHEPAQTQKLFTEWDGVDYDITLRLMGEELRVVVETSFTVDISDAIPPEADGHPFLDELEYPLSAEEWIPQPSAGHARTAVLLGASDLAGATLLPWAEKALHEIVDRIRAGR
jgi:hypothetical protein